MARFEEVAPNRAVDSVQIGKEWMMVPEGGENLARLTNGAGFVVKAGAKGPPLRVQEINKNDVPKVLVSVAGNVFRKDDRLFRISSKHAGEASLEARKGADVIRLAVSVHKKVVLKVVFFFLQDKDARGGVRTRTRFTPKDADTWITALNGVFGPQANIWFKKLKADPLPIENLDAVVGAEHAETLAKNKLKDAINIFLAGPNIKSTDKTHINGFYHIEQKLIILKDRITSTSGNQPDNPMLQTMAHEIGHFMNHKRGGGEGHDFFERCGYNSDILNTIDGNNIKIPRQRVLDWNPW